MMDTVSPGAKAAIEHLDGNWDLYLEQLMDLVRIPGISAVKSPDENMKKSAEAVAVLMRRAGLEKCEVIEFENGHPYVYGEWLGAPGAPTLVLYAHHDVTPPGRAEKWLSPPFEPVMGNDGRLYGRGVADDKAGVMMHVAACAAWLQSGNKLPVNVKLIIEGEEESGSPSLESFLDTCKDRLSGDVLIMTDTANLEAGLPSITTSLRGNVSCTVEVRSIAQPIHSGLWGGPIPDPVMALSKAVAELVDEHGRPAFKGGWENIRPLSEKESEELEKLPFNEKAIRSDLGMAKSARLTGDPGMPPHGRIFRQPALTVIAFESRTLENASNQIIESARCRISMRIVPDQDPGKTLEALMQHFRDKTPWGLEVNVEPCKDSGWWMTDISHPAFDAASRALKKGYGRDPVFIGCGGSIPFVEPFARVLGGVPAILLGVEDPKCNAHGENESLNVDDWKSGIRSAVHLYEEMALALNG